MSSISQIERSSSQMRILGMRALPNQLSPGGFGYRLLRRERKCRFNGLSHPQYERTAVFLLRSDKYFALVRLHNLVNDRQAKPGAALESRLERLEYFFHHLRIHARTSISKAELPLMLHFLNADRQRSTFFHGPDGVLAEVPENLLHSVSIGKNRG